MPYTIKGEKYLTLQEAAVELGRNRKTVLQRIHDNLLPGAFKDGNRGRWLIPATSVAVMPRKRS